MTLSALSGKQNRLNSEHLNPEAIVMAHPSHARCQGSRNYIRRNNDARTGLSAKRSGRISAR